MPSTCGPSLRDHLEILPMRLLLALSPLSLLVLCGCPAPGSAVTAVLGASSTSGNAPLTVTFSAAGSTSRNAGALSYQWGLGDSTTSTAISFDHTYTNPGRYVVQLTVTDAANETGTDSTEIRVAGIGATAVLSASVTSGTAPLLVRFDASGSSAPDDTIRDYLWNFGDGTTSQVIAPMHQYSAAGTYAVTLTVTTAGGVSDTATETITVAERVGSLQFNGANFATLPLDPNSVAQNLGAATFEAWVKADGDGGTVASIGAGALTVAVQPNQTRVRVQYAGTPTDGSASSLGGSWRHIAVVFDNSASNTVRIYLDGASLASGPVSGSLVAENIVLGTGYTGQIAEVRFWTVARTASQIQANRNTRLSGNEANLLGYWRLDELTGQTLNNLGSGNVDGTLGTSTAPEAADPVWSTDGPSL
jgi:PKD repeat protein